MGQERRRRSRARALVYRLAPAVAAASAVAAVLLVPVAAAAPDSGVGHDVLALAGLLALARFAVAAASWDVANGFSLMGASRDLTISVFVEATSSSRSRSRRSSRARPTCVGMVAGTAGTARLVDARRSRSPRSRSRSSWSPRRAASRSTTPTRTSS